MKGTEYRKDCSVLLAEDNRINQKLVVLMLGKLGIQPVLANDGFEAVEKALAQDFDLILMDIHMPGKNGLEAMDEIKAALGEKTPRIVALTADVVQANIKDALERGVDEYLTKPINRESLRVCIEKYCG